ncbi:MAG: hypothetical protein HPY83_08170 [Anaerolineae bacterium]|nr:hypothetical protein [Anaerolineae bacterium]
MSDQGREGQKDVWGELGQQFEELGRTLAATIRSAAESEENRRRLQELEKGLRRMAEDVSRAIDEGVSSPEGQRVMAQMERTAESARRAGEQALDEARPHILAALRRLNDELERLTERMSRRD